MTNLIRITSEIEMLQSKIATLQKQADKALSKDLYDVAAMDLIHQISYLESKLIATIEVANLLSLSSSFYLKLS